MLDSSNVDNLIIRNDNGLLFTIGDTVYYNLIESKALNIITRKVIIKSFMINKKGIYVITRNMDEPYYVSINDLFKDEHSAKEVIKKWQKEVLQKELRKEITSSLKSL